MHDESCITYSAAIAQMTVDLKFFFNWKTGLKVWNYQQEGHRWMTETFGLNDTTYPRFGWQIDPFGATTVGKTILLLEVDQIIVKFMNILQ